MRAEESNEIYELCDDVFVSYLLIFTNLQQCNRPKRQCNLFILYNKSKITVITMDIFQQIQASKHWDQQLNLLQQLPISESTTKLLNISKNGTVIRNMLLNPRSKLVTSTVDFLIEMFDKYGALLHPFALFLVGSQVLFKLINSSNKIIYSCTNELFKSIIMHSPHSKFYPILITEFNSKNAQVRESISSYVLVLSDIIEFPNHLVSVVKMWKSDASKIVRDNANELQMLIQKQKLKKNQLKAKQKQRKLRFRMNSNAFEDKQNINDDVPQLKCLVSEKQQKQSKQNYLKQHSNQNSQIILQSFMKVGEQTVEMASTSNIQFLISKLHSDQTWNMKLFAIQQLISIFKQIVLDQLEIYLQDVVYGKMLPVFVQLLNEKRSKINVQACSLVSITIQLNSKLFGKFLTNNFTDFVEKAVKNQQMGRQIISLSIDIDPLKYVTQLAQISVDTKSLKQKVLLLDLLVEKVCEHPLPATKVPTIIKLTCKNIEKHELNKQICLPSLAVLSHLKISYPNEFLSCVLCLQKQLLNKIIYLAESIDPQLRQSIISYIHTLKGSEKSDRRQQFSFDRNQQLQSLIEEVCNQQEQSINNLVQYIFQSRDHVSVKQFYQIIKLTEKVTSKNSLLQLQLLLEQICKTQNQNFLQALFQAVNSCNPGTIEAEYIIAYLRKIQLIFCNCPWFMNGKRASRLIQLYRISKCPKVRMLCIKNLALFPSQLTASYVSSKQKQLISTHQKLQINT